MCICHFLTSAKSQLYDNTAHDKACVSVRRRMKSWTERDVWKKTPLPVLIPCTVTEQANVDLRKYRTFSDYIREVVKLVFELHVSRTWDCGTTSHVLKTWLASSAFCDEALCSLVDQYQRLGENSCLHLHCIFQKSGDPEDSISTVTALSMSHLTPKCHQHSDIQFRVSTSVQLPTNLTKDIRDFPPCEFWDRFFSYCGMQTCC